MLSSLWLCGPQSEHTPVHCEEEVDYLVTHPLSCQWSEVVTITDMQHADMIDIYWREHLLLPQCCLIWPPPSRQKHPDGIHVVFCQLWVTNRCLNRSSFTFLLQQMSVYIAVHAPAIVIFNVRRSHALGSLEWVCTHYNILVSIVSFFLQYYQQYSWYI